MRKTLLSMLALLPLLAARPALSQTEALPWDPQVLSDDRVIELLRWQLDDWQTRTEVFVSGNLSLVMHHQVMHDVTGQPRHLLLSERTSDARVPPHGRQRLSQTLDARRWVRELRETLRFYLEAPDLARIDFFRRAHSMPGERELAGTTGISGSDFLRPGDSMTWWLEGDTRHPIRMELHAPLKEAEAQMTVDFGRSPDGMPFIASIITEVPDKNLRIIVQAFAHRRVGAP